MRNYIILILFVMVSCKDERKNESNTVVEPTKVEIKSEVNPDEIKLPKDIVQINEEFYDGNGITLTKVQIQDSKDDNFIFKIFFNTENIETFKNGDYSLFLQNFPYEDDKPKLNAKFQESGLASYWINLKSLKPYKGEYVLFLAFKSEIYNFEKIELGVMNLKEKTDVFRTQYYDVDIVK